MLTNRQAIEVFHLLFLRGFGARVDKGLFALKGGCNLRFFFKSIRYSEDMDLDVHTMAVSTLQNNVNRLFKTPAFVAGLRAQGIELTRTAQPKQTETTQRWKVGLRILESGVQIPTKIVFSRRGLDDGTAVEAVDPAVIRAYRLYPVLVRHYAARAAFSQKVAALALREQVQSRDVFDLKLLLDAGGAEPPLSPNASKHLATAIENALSVDYDAFAGEVTAYLEPEFREHYGNKNAWNDLQEGVVRALEALQS